MDRMIKNLLLLSQDAMVMVEKRYNILRSISYIQPVGRRQLAVHLGCTEREARSETDYLRKRGLIRVEPSGMILTMSGNRLLEEMLVYIPQLTDKSTLETKIKELYGIKKVTVVSGDINTRTLIHRDLGQSAALELCKAVSSIHTVALTGHSDVGYMVESKFPQVSAGHITVCPARTAQLNTEDISANEHCYHMARKCGAKYKLLHLGEGLTMNEIEKRYNEPDVTEIVTLVKNTDILVSGITPIQKSALLQSMSTRAQDSLLKGEPCCELLGSFLKKDGRQINNPPLYSISVDQIAKIPTFMLIAGGRDYLPSIIALSMRFKNIHLVTDDATARMLLAYKNEV